MSTRQAAAGTRRMTQSKPKVARIVLAFSTLLLATTACGGVGGGSSHIPLDKLSVVAHQVPLPDGLVFVKEKQWVSKNDLKGTSSNEVELDFTTTKQCAALQSEWESALTASGRKWVTRGGGVQTSFLDVQGADARIYINGPSESHRPCGDVSINVGDSKG